ncbi:cellulase family glycosylhydrolase [Proteiniphilum sp.]|uniref:cellulase family glycosylhydrolase n=1 Tax=Proteiniphilum sp. TaxID=1926877 RepID=UPI003331F77D
MKRIIIPVLICLLITPVYVFAQKGRAQWTEKEAWAWHKKVGIIKGFNEPVGAYPGMSRKQVLEKAVEQGFNSVRFWIQTYPDNIALENPGRDVKQHIALIEELATEADALGLTISPVLPISYMYFEQPDKEKAMGEAKAFTQELIAAFANDERIILWDIWNEPRMDDVPEMYEQMDWIEAMVGWCREKNPVQPITASIFYDSGVRPDSVSRAISRRSEVEAIMDVHNFHHYESGSDHMERIEWMVERLQKISNRPLICTEAIARTTGSTFPRTFIPFAKHQIHFYTWGLYMCDMNWTVTWGRNTYEPFDPVFHELLHPDGEPIDRRELDWLRNFRFTESNENTDPGAEWTERWTKDRAWKWMVAGPIKGVAYKEGESSYATEYNSERVKCSYQEWKKDENLFYQNMDKLLDRAEGAGRRILPALLSDKDVNEKDSVLATYVAKVVRRYATDPRIQAWEIYTYPGAMEINTAKLTDLLQLLFRFARFEYPNQPLLATPHIRVKDFPSDFRYKEALIHGRLKGWDMLISEGGSTPELCNLIWSLSDVIAFSSNQKASETGWLTSIAYRYGRPLVCTEWTPPSESEAEKTLDVFSKSHVFWYNTGDWYDKEMIDSFGFKPITTPIL